MTEILLLKSKFVIAEDIEIALRDSNSLSYESTSLFIDDQANLILKNLARKASTIEPFGAELDSDIAAELYVALNRIRIDNDWLLNEPGFWHWLTLEYFRDYSLLRWCGGRGWLDDPNLRSFKDSTLERLGVIRGSVKSHARHVLRRLYIVASAAQEFNGSNDQIKKIFEKDTDIFGAVFERTLGLNPVMSIVLARCAGDLPNRDIRRIFFRDVNLTTATIAVETFTKKQLEILFEEIRDETLLANPASKKEVRLGKNVKSKKKT